MFKINEGCRIFLCLGVMAGGVFEAHAMTVVAPDQTPVTIVIPVKAGRPLSFAAEEFQEYIIQITDVRLDIEHDGTSVRGAKAPAQLHGCPQSSGQDATAQSRSSDRKFG